MASLLNLINRLLPFATPGTPIMQDLIHLGVIATLLYFAPQIQERFRQHRDDEVADTVLEDETHQEEPQQHVNEEAGNQDHDHIADEGNANQDAMPDLDIPGHPVEGEAGPADAPNMPAQRNVGAKKSKSLARKDQRRAYNEFMRSQGEAQRARDAEGAAEREAEQNAERERRRAAAAVVEAKKAKEREERKERERTAHENEINRRDEVLGMVRRELDESGTSNLIDVAGRMGGDADEIWVERILNAGGVLGWSPDGERLTLVLSTGWVARVGRRDMQQVYKRAASTGAADSKGRISYGEFGRLLEVVLREQPHI
ncbi:uncharacterized protein RCC_04711 [Ramularia collo-cygni]|uniref:Uncharacterized protein n=1 Tax=Ramularia collo-cygni TaxID=112498 RepID=A0A2D3V5R1_9PEZI|nr:uncharacterized protein RCC_04711 [Ramularia collo-cygni]CZT18866.1 uncharacterized protein RCC_04711 [Ramularia collo-cygni]